VIIKNVMTVFQDKTPEIMQIFVVKKGMYEIEKEKSFATIDRSYAMNAKEVVKQD